MDSGDILSISRRQLLQLLGIGGVAALGSMWPELEAKAQGRDGTLVIGIDISDTTELDPARDLHYSPPMTIAACYETLVTMTPGDYITIKPALASKWERTPDGKGWRFYLRRNVKFVTGNPMTAKDVKYSLDRVHYIKHQSSQYLSNVDRVDIVDDYTVDVVLKNPSEPLLSILVAPSFAVTDSKVVAEHGGDATLESDKKDKATDWLNQNSVGTGPYRLTAWQRNAQILMVANPNYWGGKPAFQRVVIRHFDDGAAQLLALRRGDIDCAFNLLPEQILALKDEKTSNVDASASLDFVYMALSYSPELNKALAIKECRQAIGYAIDYDGIIKSLLGGSAIRSASFLPVGTVGSTEETTKEIGFRQDLDRAKKLLAQAGMPDGFEFELIYGTSAVAGTSYHVLGQKLQADLARVGIKLKLSPMPMLNTRTLFTNGKASAVLTYWNPPAVETSMWGAASVERLAKRLHWKPSEEMLKVVQDGTKEEDATKQAALWRKYQEMMVDEASLIILFQPIYQIGVSQRLKSFPLTSAGWLLDISSVKRT